MPDAKQVEKLRQVRLQLEEAERLAGIGKNKNATTRAQGAYHEALTQGRRDLSTIARYRWEPKNPELRAAWKADAEKFLREAFPNAFKARFCPTHQRLIAKTQDIATNGGQYAAALWRRGGKTAIFVRMMIWAIVNGYHRFGVVVGANAKNTNSILDGLKTEFKGNPQLTAQYPEACNPLNELNGDGKRALGQWWGEQKTAIGLGSYSLRLATIPATIAAGNAGAQIWALSIASAARGIQNVLPDGTILRPSFIMLDDVQTDKSAKSMTETLTRIDIIDRGIMGTFGGDAPPCAVMACTPIVDGDLACHYLDRNKAPEWRGDTTALMKSFPSNMQWWDDYRALKTRMLKTDGDTNAASRMYRDDRARADAGAVVEWPEMETPGSLSVVQFCMDKWQAKDGGAAFEAEFQCKPRTANRGGDMMLDAESIAKKVSGLRETIVPEEAEWLTAFVDAGKAYLFYAVCAWSKDYTGTCIEYGAWPRQYKVYYTKDDANPTIESYFAATRPGLAGANEATMLAAALDTFLPDLMQRTYRTLTGTEFSIKRILCDAGDLGDVVCAAIARLNQPRERLPIVMPSKGFGLKENENDMAEWKINPGDVVGWHWRAPAPKAGALRGVQIDTNHFKSHVHKELFVDPLRPGNFTLWGTRDSRGNVEANHNMISHQLTAELPDRVFSDRRQKWRTKWRLKPNAENEGLDCMVGCAVGASMLGAELQGAGEPPKRKGKRTVNWSEYVNL